MQKGFLEKYRLGWFSRYLWINSILLLGISTRYLLVGGFPDTVPAAIFFILMGLGHLATLSLIMLLPAFLLQLLFPRSKVSLVVAVVLCSLLCFFVVLDTFVFQLYRFHINRAMFEMFFGPASKEIFVFSRANYISVLSVLLGIFIIQTFLAYQLTRVKKVSRFRPGLCALFVGILLFHHFAYALADARSYVPVIQQARLLPAYFPTTLRSSFHALGISVNNSELGEISTSERNSAIQYPLHPLDCAGPESPVNILFVVIDSWRYDMLTPEVSPHLSTFSKQASNFLDHSSGGSATRTGIFSLFYGLTADYWHAFLHERRGPVLIEQLLKQHYQMGIFGSAPLASPEFFQTVFVDVPDLRMRSNGDTSWQRDVNITDDFLGFLEKRDKSRPFFGFLFYDAPHAFSLPADGPRIFTPSLDEPDFLALNASYDPVPFFNLYKNTIHFDDSLIGRVFDALDKEDLKKQTIIVVTGDHGQEFNENGLNYWGHSGNFSRYQIGVPLSVWWPGKTPENKSYPTNHIDLAPTLLKEVLRCSNPISDYSFGEDLFVNGDRKFFLVGNYGEQALVQSDRITLIHSYGGLEEVDPRLHPLEDQHHRPELLKRFLTMQSAFLRP